MASPSNVVRSNDAGDPQVAAVDMKLEVVVIPVSDVDRSEQFYRKLGWRQDVTPPGSGVFQFTPHGSSCSVQFGKNLTSAAPGSVQGMQLVVKDIVAAKAELDQRGVDCGEVQDFPWGRFVFFADPDGNRWAVQEIPQRT